MSSSLGMPPSSEELEWEALQADMQFYCSYCMLTEVSPKTVVVGMAEYSDAVTDIQRQLGEQERKISVTMSRDCLEYSILLLCNINPYIFADDFTRILVGPIMSDTPFGARLTVVEETIEENSDYIVCKSVLGDMRLTVRTYKHTAESLGMSLVSMRKYCDQIGTNEDGCSVGTICYKAAQNTRCMALLNERLLGMNIEPTLQYSLPDGVTVEKVNPDVIVRHMIDLIEKEFGPLNNEYVLNLRARISQIHTPLGVPLLDPYTRHGSTPIEYQRIWSFIHCCRDTLPRCQFDALCRYIVEVFFLLAERNIEVYCDKKIESTSTH